MTSHGITNGKPTRCPSTSHTTAMGTSPMGTARTAAVSANTKAVAARTWDCPRLG